MLKLNTSLKVISPLIHLSLAWLISLVTMFLAFRDVALSEETSQTFIAFYALVFLMVPIYKFRRKLTNPRTSQLLQFAYTMLGIVLMVTSILGSLQASMETIAAFMLMVFLPGLALLRCGLNFQKQDEPNEN